MVHKESDQYVFLQAPILYYVQRRFPLFQGMFCPVNETSPFFGPADSNKTNGEILPTASLQKNTKRTRFTIDAILDNEREDEKYNPSKQTKSSESSVNNPNTSVDSEVISNFD